MKCWYIVFITYQKLQSFVYLRHYATVFHAVNPVTVAVGAVCYTAARTVATTVC